MGCVREGWLVASPAVRHSDHYCSDDERQSQESAGHERSPRRLNIFSRQGYLFGLQPEIQILSIGPGLIQFIQVLSSLTNSYPGLGQCLEEEVEQTERLCPKKQDWVSAG